MLKQHCVPASEWAVWLTDRLQGKAQSLLVNLDEEDLNSWDRLVAAMNAQFHVAQDGAAAREELMNRRQGRRETVADFINDLQLLGRRAYADNTSKRKEVIMDRLRDGLSTPSLRQCFDACEEYEDMPFLAIQNHLIHRESRDEPEKYRASVASSLCHPGGHDQPNDSEPREEGTDTVLLLVETLKGLQLSQRPLAEPATDPRFPPRTEYFGQAGVCWQCGSQHHMRRDCPRLPLHTREFLQEYACP